MTAFIGMAWSCSSDDAFDNEKGSEGSIQFSVQHAEKAKLPDCIVHFVDSLEIIKESTHALGTGIIFQVNHSGNTVYAIYAPFSTVKGLQFLNDEGSVIPLDSQETYDNYIKEVTIWQCLYTIRDEKTVSLSGIQDVPYIPESSNNYPQWLQNQLKGNQFLDCTILRGTWNGSTYYQVYSSLMSSLDGNTYDEYGNYISNWDDQGMSSGDFVKAVTDWVCIFHLTLSDAAICYKGLNIQKN